MLHLTGMRHRFLSSFKKYEIVSCGTRGDGTGAGGNWCVGTGGIDTVNGVVIGSAGHIQNWEGSRIKEEMEKMFHLPTTVLNDANAAALGEMWIGAAADRRNVIVMTVGTGVGGGIIVDSKILLGANGLAGEIGHIVINSDGELCSCGNHGCMEHLVQPLL